MNFSYETSRLLLKVLEPSRAHQVLRFYLNNREIFEPSEPEHPKNYYTIDHQRTLLTAEYNMAVQSSLIRFWIFLKEEPEEIIGTVSFREITRRCHQSCLLGYKFDKSHWGHGYATEAVREGIRIMFDEQQLHRITAKVMPENTRSIALLNRIGFVNEGIERKSVYLNGVWEDHIRFSLISSS